LGFGERLEFSRERWQIFELRGVFRVDIQTARATDHDESGVDAGQNIAQVLETAGMLRKRLGGPCAERVHDHVESGEVGGGQVEQILDYDVLRDGLVVTAHHGGHVMTAFHGFLDDELAFASVRCHNCDLHNGSFRLGASDQCLT
jgi:hypothetical protein